ncbi:MAG TPA: tetratricopeptide repeat protein [Planctomycetes bacterium]|nr:tetratricopeptide repeat protein [Planctomycetota bacterium]HIK60665.1 tetratricopeptide repeat protein [Planctomycetota bacterium]
MSSMDDIRYGDGHSSNEPRSDSSASSQGGDAMGSTEEFHTGWGADLSETEVALQENLSCLVDGELDEAAAARVMVQMEESEACRAFFDDAMRYVRLHKDMVDPARLEARLATLSGAIDGDSGSDPMQNIAAEAERIDLVHRLATIFYQLGKAYVLAGVDLDAFRERVFESAVAVDPGTSHADAKTAGRGFVDGVLLTGRDAQTGVDWRQARHLLNGRLERIAEPLDKGRRLLHQAIETDCDHEEAKIYLAFLMAHEGKTLRAAEIYRDVFDTALSQENRGHAANQLGRLYNAEGNWRKAITCWRWITTTGLADNDPRFWMARLNIALAYAYTGDRQRSLDYFRQLLDLHPDRATDVAQVVGETDQLRTAINSQPGFLEAFFTRCPELFGQPSPQDDSRPGSESSDGPGEVNG